MGTLKGESEGLRGSTGASVGTTIVTSDGVVEGTTMGALAGAIGTVSGVTDGTTIGKLTGAGSLGVNLASVGTKIGTANRVAHDTTMGALASAGSAITRGLEGAGSQAITLGSKVPGGIVGAANLTGSRAISIVSKRVGVISNDGSSLGWHIRGCHLGW
jgi:hypothetical protein